MTNLQANHPGLRFDLRGLFDDRPPHWPVNKGKPWARPSQTALEAALQRDAHVYKLRWHGKRDDYQPDLTLANILAACNPPLYPCLCGACPICIRAQQRFSVTATNTVLPQFGGITYPIRVITARSIEATAGYGLKAIFVRRVSILKSNSGRDNRGACLNTRDRFLRGPAWVELMILLGRIGLERRLLGYGFRIPYSPLRSRNPAERGAGQ